MELVIAIVLFVAIVAAWVVLPSTPPSKAADTSAAPAAATKAGHIA